MNKIWTCLGKSQSSFKKMNGISTKVNAERLQTAVVSVLLEDYPDKTIAELEALYEGIDVNTGKNTKNLMRNKITGVCNLFEITNRKKRTQFFSKIVAFLEAEMEFDFVEGWKMDDYKHDEFEMGEDDEDDDEEDDDEDDDKDDVDEKEIDNSRFFVEGADTENGWGYTYKL